MIAAFLLPMAHAAVTNQTWRIGYRVNLADADSVHGDDYFRNPTGVHIARYAEVWLCPASCSQVDWILGPKFTDEDGYVTFTVDTNVDYRVVLVAHTDWEQTGRHVYVIPQEPYLTQRYWGASPLFRPTAAVDVFDMIFDAAFPTRDWINALAIGSWVIKRRPNAFPTQADNGAVYKILHTEWPNETVYSPSVMTVHLNPPERVLKYTIAHEFGHMLLHSGNYPGPPEALFDWRVLLDYSATDPTHSCYQGGGHSYTSKEYTSAAMNEGFGNFVAAMAFNLTNQADCRWVPPPNAQYDWDPNNPFNQLSDLPFSCEGAPGDVGGAEWVSAAVPGGDYLFNYCMNGPPWWNRGTALDWMRFFWDSTTKSNMLLSDIVEVLVDAEPHTWNPGDTGPADDFPMVRIHYAFIDGGWEPVWNAQAGPNGLR